jgi:hypothetical protein
VGKGVPPTIVNLAFRHEPLPTPCPVFWEKATAFAERIQAGAAKYLNERKSVYHAAVAVEQRQKFLAVALVQEFASADRRFAYLGPLFSTRGGYLPLFAWYSARLVAQGPEQSLYLAAEIQSPEVLLAFALLFPQSSFPRIEDGAIPPDVRAAAEVFAARLDHIGTLNPDNLATRSEETLYAPRPRCEPVMQWLRRRGIDPARGDSQLVVVRGNASPWDNAAFLVELAEGRLSLEPGGHGRERALERFRRANRE